MGNNNKLETFHGLCEDCKNDVDIELSNKCYECGGYVHLCPKCNPLIYCKCNICNICNKKKYNDIHTNKSSPRYCLCSFDYYKIQKKLKIKKRSRSNSISLTNIYNHTFVPTYVVFNPSGLVNYMEIEIIKFGVCDIGRIGIAESGLIFKLMHAEPDDICCNRGYSLYWSPNGIRLSTGLIGIGSNEYKYHAGDTVGIKLSNDRKKLSLVKNGIVKYSYTLPFSCFPNFSFYVYFQDAKLKINDSTCYKLLKYKNLNQLIIINRNEFIDLYVIFKIDFDNYQKI